MEKISRHKLLVAGDSFENCCHQVHKFFDLTSLVIYDCIQVIDAECISGMDTDFIPAIRAAEQKNRERVRDLVDELRQTGAQAITDLAGLEHGYPSKVLHVLSHFLDGFIGIDSFFYSIHDDSHWLTDQAEKDIQANPGSYWLIHIDGYSASPEEAGLLRM